MASSTDVLLIALCLGDSIGDFNSYIEESKVQFEVEDDATNKITLGKRFQSWEIFSFADRCIPRENLLLLIEKFKAYDFKEVDSAVLWVSDDNWEDLEGIYVHPNNSGVKLLGK